MCMCIGHLAQQELQENVHIILGEQEVFIRCRGMAAHSETVRTTAWLAYQSSECSVCCPPISTQFLAQCLMDKKLLPYV